MAGGGHSILSWSGGCSLNLDNIVVQIKNTGVVVIFFLCNTWWHTERNKAEGCVHRVFFGSRAIPQRGVISSGKFDFVIFVCWFSVLFAL